MGEDCCTCWDIPRSDCCYCGYEARREREREDEGLLSVAVAHHEASEAAEKALYERAIRAEQRVRDLEEAQGELLRLLGVAEWFEGHLREQLEEAEAGRDHLREALDRVLEIARGDFAGEVPDA